MGNEKQKIKIKVVGVGGAGGKYLDYLIKNKIGGAGVEFIALDTSKNDLEKLNVSKKLCLGASVTNGVGAGSDPRIGQQVAEESGAEIKSLLNGADFIIFLAGLGGGTGTGATPVVAKIANELKILTLAIVTKPFTFEGQIKNTNAEIGLENLASFVDAYLPFDNQSLVTSLSQDTKLPEAFNLVNEKIGAVVRCLTETVIKPLEINLDLASIAQVLHRGGAIFVGQGRADGKNNLNEALKQALKNVGGNCDLRRAKGLICVIKTGENISLSEMSQSTKILRETFNDKCQLKYGIDLDPQTSGTLVTIIVSGLGR